MKIQLPYQLSLLLCVFTTIYAPGVVKAQSQLSKISMPVISPGEAGPCITPEQQEELKARTIVNIARLKSEGTLMPVANKSAVVTQHFNWPLTYQSDFYDNDYFFIQNYIDHDALSGSTEEYMCGTRTYDVSGYNHTGTDICIGPYWWSMMDNTFVNVIAAAPGQIVDKADGNFDRNCAMGGGNANFIKIMHSDGSFAIYFHMKSGSVTSKNIGQEVALGEYLGLVGSSGSSTNPHLHFEVQDQANAMIDPWAGPCNFQIASSLWNNQKPYDNPGVLRLLTSSSAPAIPSCPAPETLHLKNHFNAGDAIRFDAYFRDLVPGQNIAFDVYDPSGNSIGSWPIVTSGSFDAMGGYWVATTLSASAPSGTYKFQVSYSGKTAAHYFTEGCPGAYTLSTPQSGYKGYVSGSTITSTAIIGGLSSNNIWYEAETYVQANPGFRVTAGCHFRARIADCTVGSVREGSITGVETHGGAWLRPVPSVANESCKLEFELYDDDVITISVADVTGRKLFPLVSAQSFTGGKHEIQLNTSSLMNGIYFCLLTGSKEQTTCRLIVQH